MSLRSAAVSLLGIALATPSVSAQTGLAGRITDAQHAVVVGAVIRATPAGRSDAAQTKSDARGAYRLEGLPPGWVVIEVTASGFRRHSGVVRLGAGAVSALDVMLHVPGVDEAVVVTAAGRPQIQQETAKALTVIDAETVHARNGHMLADVMRMVPGVQVRNSGGPGQATQVRIRGLRPDATAVLVDGLRFRDASTTQGDASSFISSLNLVNAERIEVLRGSGSSLYGTNAVGGAVNIVTRPGGGSFGGDAQVEGGSLGHARARGSLHGAALRDRVRYSIGVQQFNLLDGLDGHDAARSTGAHGMLQYDLSPTASLTLRVLGSDDRTDINVSPTASVIPAANIPDATIVEAIPVAPGEIARANRGLPFDVGPATYIPGRDDPDSLRTSAFHATAVTVRHHPGPLSWQASYQRVHTRRTFINGPLGPGFQPEADNVSTFTGEVDTMDARVFAAPAPWLEVSAGYEFERERYGDRQDNHLLPPRRLRTETAIRQDAHAVFASAQIAPLGRRLQFGISGRGQRFSLTSPRFTATGVTSPYAGVPLTAPPRALTVDLSAAYFVEGPGTKLRAHLGNAYRAPALFERFGGGFSTDPVTGLVVFTAFGDPRLEPDRYRTIDVGVDQYVFGSRALLSATAFYNDVTSLTAFDASGAIRPDADPFGRSAGYHNSSGGFSTGLELGLEARPNDAVRVRASYTYTQAETEEDVTVPGFFRVPGVFRHTATLVATGRVSRRLDVTCDLFYGSDSYASLFAAGRSRAYRFPAFARAAVVAGYRLLDAGRRSVRAYIEVDNLFDTTYYEGGWRNPGRTILAGVSAGF